MVLIDVPNSAADGLFIIISDIKVNIPNQSIEIYTHHRTGKMISKMRTIPNT